MSKTNTTTKPPFTPYPFEAFVKNWQKASNIEEVVNATGLARNTVSSMATNLRKKGVKLKDMPRRIARPVDVNTLNKIAAEAAPKRP